LLPIPNYRPITQKYSSSFLYPFLGKETKWLLSNQKLAFERKMLQIMCFYNLLIVLIKDSTFGNTHKKSYFIYQVLDLGKKTWSSDLDAPDDLF
jgi:hypothetical protein